MPIKKGLRTYISPRLIIESLRCLLGISFSFTSSMTSTVSASVVIIDTFLSYSLKGVLAKIKSTGTISIGNSIISSAITDKQARVSF